MSAIQIVLDVPKPKGIITLDGLGEPSLHKYYGVEVPHEGRGFIARGEYGDGDFIAKCPSALTNGNNWPEVRSVSLKMTIFNCLSAGYSVHMFGTWRELFQWMSDGNP